jgi:uncharacterized membrane protein YdjX (TVP38/TMEM64 family)
MLPRLGEKYKDIEIEVMSKPVVEYQTDEYFELELPVAPAVMVADEIVVEGASVSQDKVENVICRCLGISEPEPEKKGLLGRFFGLMESNKNRRGPAIKAAVLIIFLVAAIVIARFTPLREYLTAEKLRLLLDTAGPWAPVAYIGAYAAGVCFFMPGTLLATVGAAIFGPYYGFLYVWVGAMIGAVLAFFIGRYFGRDFAASLIGDKLRKYDEAIERNGFATVLYLRLVYFPFTAMNFGMGLTRVRFRDYFSGTALGIIVGTFIFTFFVGTIKDVWSSGQWGGLLSWKVFFSLGLFVFSFFIPKIIERLRASQKVEIA